MRRIALTLAAALALGLAACGGDDSDRAQRRDSRQAAGRRRLPRPPRRDPQLHRVQPRAEGGPRARGQGVHGLRAPEHRAGRRPARRQLLPDARRTSTDQEQARGFKAVSIVGVHIEPLGLYSRKVKDLADDPASGAQVAIPNDTDQRGPRAAAARGQPAAHAQGRRGRDGDDPRHRRQPEGPGVRRGRGRPDAARAGRRRPRGDQRQLRARGRPHARRGRPRRSSRPRTTRTPTCSSRSRRSRDDPRVKKLAKLLTSPEVKKFIESKYRGAVLPTF